MARDHRRWPRTVPDRGRRRPRVPARHNRRSRCGAATARDVRSRRLPRGRPGLPLGRQFLQPAHSPAGRSGRHASMKVLSMFNHERVDRGIATPAERLAVAALDEMPDEDDDAVRAWAPSAAFRDAVRSSALATLALCALRRHRRGARRRSRPRRRRRRDDALTAPLLQQGKDEVERRGACSSGTGSAKKRHGRSRTRT